MNKTPATKKRQKKFTQKDANEMYKYFALGKQIDKKQLKIGMNVELEHGTKNRATNITNDNMLTTAKIAIAHLQEDPMYYNKLNRIGL